MPLSNCDSCGKIFNRLSRPICAECFDAQRAREAEIVQYVKDHPDADVTQVADALGADISVVLSLIRDKRLTMGEGPSLRCKSCGALSGRNSLCAECRERLQKALSPAQDGEAPRAGVRMVTPQRRRGDGSRR